MFYVDRKRSGKGLWIAILFSFVICLYTIASGVSFSQLDCDRKLDTKWNVIIKKNERNPEGSSSVTAVADNNLSKDKDKGPSRLSFDAVLTQHLREAKVTVEQLKIENDRLRKEITMLKMNNADMVQGQITYPATEISSDKWNIFVSNSKFSLNVLKNSSVWYGVEDIETATDFKCPSAEARISKPFIARKEIENQLSTRNYSNPEEIHKRYPDAWIYFHHVRKAAGSWFCKTAKINLGYEWMEDRANRCQLYNEKRYNDAKTGVYGTFSSNQLYRMIRESGSMILAPQWDVMEKERFALKQKGAVFITILRDPLQRLVSQAIYEFREDGLKNLTKISQKRNDNFLVRTFAGLTAPPTEANPVRFRHFRKAQEVLLEFDFLLIYEFLSDGVKSLQERLRWKKMDLSTQVNKSKLDKNELLKHVSIPLLQTLVADNIWDIMLYTWAKRVFLERYACEGPSLAIMS